MKNDQIRLITEDKQMVEVFGTLGPACDNKKVLTDMFSNGMTGIRVNLSHVMLSDCAQSIERIFASAKETGIQPKILIDMQGPELRIGRFEGKKKFVAGETVRLGNDQIPVDRSILQALEIEDEVLLDDGKISGQVIAVDEKGALIEVRRGGELTQRKSILIKNKDIRLPAITNDDRANLNLSKKFGVTGIMQPFVRSRDDLLQVRKALDEYGCEDLKIYAKIENRAGVEKHYVFY